MSGLEALLAQQIIGLSEAIDDEVASLLVAGTGISLSYNDGAGTLTIANTGLGGSTGSTDNRILRSDGTGGATVQNSAVTIDDSGNISGLGTVGCGAITASGTITANTSFVTQSLTITGGSPSTIVSSNRLSFTGSSAFRFWRGGNFFDVDVGSGGVANFQGAITATSGSFTGLVTVGTYTVATLPSAAANAGALAQVTDSSVTANGSAVAGGGSNRVVVFSNGSTWDVVVA